MTFKSLVSPLINFFTGGIGQWIQIALITGIAMLVAFLWFSRSSLQNDLDKANKANIEATQKLAQITADIQDVRVKQELAVKERDELRKQTDKLLDSVRKQKLPTDCKELVKWAAKNKNDTKW